MSLGVVSRIILNVRRALRAMLPGAIVALPPLFWLIDATRRASLTTLGRDQGIFQYVAWAWLKGQRGYSEVRDVNGPLTPLVHMIFLGLGGRDEHRFRVLDLTVSSFVFALVGICLPQIWRKPRANSWKTPREMFERLGWAGAAWAVFMGQYLMYIFWDLAQRESFFDWFLLSSIALQLFAQGEQAHSQSKKEARWILAIAGFLSITTWFGKPTYVLFTVTQVLALLLERAKISRKARLGYFAIGGVVSAVVMIGVMLKYADIGTFIHISTVDVPAMYRFIWPRSAIEIFSLEGYSTTIALAIVTSTVMLGLIWKNEMPKRAIPVAFMPLVGIVNVVAQRKGFPYHFHPVTAGLAFEWLLLVVWLWERVHSASNPRGLSRVLPVLAGAVLSVRVALLMPMSPHIQSLWIYAKANEPEDREQRDYFVYFQTGDFFPWELRQTAAYLREHTTPDDRVQLYGMDPYVLFLAERLSATPYIYAYDLDADAALSGGQLPEPRGLHPTMQEQAKIRAIRDDHERDMLARLQAAPPAAFVFLDRSPLISWEEAAHDLEEHSPTSYAWMSAHYKQTADFHGYRVYMRNELADRIADEERKSSPAPLIEEPKPGDEHADP